MSRLDALRGAADNAAKKALQKVEKINTEQFQSLISELRKNGVDAATISQLESAINDSTRRNKLVTGIVEKGGNLSKQIVAIVSKFL